MLSSSNGSHKIFDRAMIFHAWHALDTAANIHSVWSYRFDRTANILRV
jgi:hypothetical protein